METRLIIDVLLGTCMAALGWFSREMWSAVKDLKSDIALLRERLPMKYALKLDLENALNRIDGKLDKIFDKLEGKADKAGNHLHRRASDSRDDQ
ncbi:MAG: hypothetical protein FWD62_01810 [Betaproteobacteria bacterium]|nr:hypothetical protein [Betaproteobacteria bacterium]